MIMTRSDSLLPLAEVTDRLRVSGHGYAGVRSIPLDTIIGSADRASEFHRDFHPRRRDSEARMRKLEAAFPNGDYPAISVFEVGGAYFVSDGTIGSHSPTSAARNSSRRRSCIWRPTIACRRTSTSHS
jgi:hypothetical protein